MNNDFSSIERLMELGMSMAVAQQMTATMNHAIGNMAVPGVGNAMTSRKEYYVVIDNAQAGPLTEEMLAQLVNEGKISDTTLMWYRGLPSWKFVKDVPEAYKWIVLSNTKK